MAEALNEQQEAAEWFIDEVRTAMLDYEELNELINNQEISREEIKKAADRTIDRYNNIDPPIAARSIWDFPVFPNETAPWDGEAEANRSLSFPRSRAAGLVV